MKFPIRRESLQAFHPVKEEDDKIIARCLDRLCRDFQQSMSMNYLKKRFVFRDIIHLHQSPEPFTEQRLLRFIDKLRATFIGCDISMDPLKTYIIIDWS